MLLKKGKQTFRNRFNIRMKLLLLKDDRIPRYEPGCKTKSFVLKISLSLPFSSVVNFLAIKPEMVQLFYYETRGKCCRKVFNYEGYPTKVMLFPYEGWAQPALVSYWLLKTYWWSRSRCKIVEVTGSKKRTTKGKMSDKGSGAMTITGKFKDAVSHDFKMTLTTNISNTDFHLGYCVTGTLEKGDKKAGDMQLTHFAMVKRKGY